MITRCLHLDWLEVHCLEPSYSDLRTADYFRRCGWVVREREYGTKVYQEMFTLLEPNTSEPMIEIRRSPNLAKSDGLQVLDPLSCHIRLANRACYFQSPAALLWQFLVEYKYEFRRISRIDLALDFEKFDSGDYPAKFLLRYLRGTYRKINVTRVNPHGEDLWEGQSWNSISWGAKKSKVGTKLYDKTRELREVKDKPYIRQSWLACGLIDDFYSMTKVKEDGTSYTPAIWRLEFSLTSDVRGWVVIEDESTKDGKRSIRNTLDCYFSDQQCLDIFASLVDHYFHFKLPMWKQPEKGKLVGELQRKDRCPDKVLFRFKERAQFYHVEHTASSSKTPAKITSLMLKLQAYKEAHPLPEVIRSCDELINFMKNDIDYFSTTRPFNAKELTYIRLMLSRRLNAPEEPMSQTIEDLKAMLQEDAYFGEH